MLHADEAPLETPQLRLPEELLLALDHHAPERKNDWHLEAWNRPSLFRRILNKLLGKIH
jgi:hypothetical protein